MTKDEALKLALEALENLYETCDWHGDDGKQAMGNAPKAITAIKEALAQQEPRNFCPRCGKRRGGDVNYIHTCTPPEGGHQ